MSSFYNSVRLVSGLQQIPLLVNCLICLGLRMAVKWGKASVDKEVLPDSSGRTDTGDQNFNLISLPEIVLNQIYFFKYGYVCLCLIISYLPGSILSAHRNQCELWAQRDCPIITLKINLFPLGIHGQHCGFGVTKTSCSTLEKKEEGTRAQNISGERQSSNFARAFFCSVGTSSSELIFRISSFLFLLHEIFGGISLMQLQAFSKNISGDTGRKIILLELRRSWIKRKVM